MEPHDDPSPPDEDPSRRVRELVQRFLDQQRAGAEPDPDQLILDNPSLAGPLEQALESLYTARSIEAGGGAPAELSAFARRAGGRYDLLHVIGSGAFGDVYLALDRVLRREVAVKILRPGTAGAASARVLQEGRASAPLTHPNIVLVHDVGAVDGGAYLVMEPVCGETLAECLARQSGGGLPFRTTAEVVRQLAQALAYAHRKGVIHRDVKPANILLDGNGVPRLTDFGLARVLGPEASVAQGDITGSPAYMAPEQAAGRSAEADGRADVYSLGVVMYEMLTGQRPFTGRDLPDLLRRVREESPVPPRRLVPAVPLDLELICLKALEKRPEDRFANAGAMETELGRWINGDPPGLRRQTLWERVRRWVRDNQVRATAGSILVLILFLVAVALVVRSFELYREGIRLDEVRLRDKQEQDALRNATVLVRDARLRLRDSMLGRVAAAQAVLREALGETAKLPEGEQRARLELAIRSAFVASLGVPDQKPILSPDRGALPFSVTQNWPVALHPDGKRMAIGLVKRQGGEQPMVWERGQRWPWPASRHDELDPDSKRPLLAYTPDGRFLVCLLSTGDVQLWDEWAKDQLAVRTGKDKQPVIAVGFVPSADRLWCCSAAGRVFSLSLPDLREEASWFVQTASPLTSAAFSHDATRVAVADAAGNVRVYRTDSDPKRMVVDTVSFVLGAAVSPLHAIHSVGRLPANPTTLTSPDDLAGTALAWSQDGSRLAGGVADGTIQLWAVERGDRLWISASAGSEIRSLQFHPNGGWLFGGTATGSGGLWNVATGAHLLRLEAQRSGGFTADGVTLAAENPRAVEFIDLHIPDIVRTLYGSSSPSRHRAWARDGRSLASIDERFGIQVWDVSHSKPTDQFRPPRAERLWAGNPAVALSDDGRYLAYASGGDEHAWLVLRDTRTHTTIGTWRMKGGYETLAYSANRFWQVREEDEDAGPYEDYPRKRRVHSVSYELEVGKAPQCLGAFRTSEAGDVRRYFDHALSSDGRYYVWSGPRVPKDRLRVEIWDVRARVRLQQVPRPAPEGETFPVFLDPRGRWFAFDDPMGPTQIYVLPTPGVPRAAARVRWVSADGRWEVEQVERRAHELRRAGEARPWVELAEDGLELLDAAASFSPESRYLVWPNREGTLTVVDLPALEARVRAFETGMVVEKVEKR